MADGMSVTTVNATLASLQTGDLVIRLHKLGDPGTYTSCGDIPAEAVAGGGSMTTPVAADIQNFALPDITVAMGTEVTWTNQDGGTSHTTTSGQNGEFDTTGWNSSSLDTGQSFSHTFNEVGTFSYTCRVHPFMSGTVTVTESGESSVGASGSSSGGSGSSDTGDGSGYRGSVDGKGH